MLFASVVHAEESGALDMAKEGAIEGAEAATEAATHEVARYMTYLDPERIPIYLAGAARLLVALAIILMVRALVRFAVRSFFGRQKKRSVRQGSNTKQLETAQHLTESVINYTALAFILLAILSVLGFDMKGLLASAGLMAVMVTFLSQSVIKDWISGVFLIIENQFAVDDWVEIGDVVGRVDSVGMRSTVVITDKGETVYIPNGSVGVVKNLSQRPQRVYIVVQTAYDAQAEDIIHALNEAAEQTSQAFKDDLAEAVEVMGLHHLSSSSVDYRLTFAAYRRKEFAISRYLNRATKEVMDKRGLEFPFPQHVIHYAKEDE